jgi:hypothetical protein
MRKMRKKVKIRKMRKLRKCKNAKNVKNYEGLGFAYGAQPSTTMCVYMTCICDFVTWTVGQCVTGRLRPGLCERVAVGLLAHAGSWREMWADYTTASHKTLADHIR